MNAQDLVRQVVTEKAARRERSEEVWKVARNRPRIARREPRGKAVPRRSLGTRNSQRGVSLAYLRSGLKTTVASGGRVTLIWAGRKCQPGSSAMTPGKL